MKKIASLALSILVLSITNQTLAQKGKKVIASANSAIKTAPISKPNPVVFVYGNDTVYQNEFERLLYKKGEHENKAKANFKKGIMNSLYGGFGMKEKTIKKIVTSEYEFNNSLSEYGNKIKDYEFISNNGNDYMIIEIEEERSKQRSIGACVRLASYISAKSRTKLHEMMRLIGYDHIYYADTDSLFTTKKIPDEYISETELGKWKLENVHEEALFIAKKLYRCKTITGKTKLSSKGIPKSLIESSDFDKLQNNEIVTKNLPHMFKRSLEGVKIISQDRSICKGNKTRKMNDDGTTKTFNNENEYINIGIRGYDKAEKILDKDIEKMFNEFKEYDTDEIKIKHKKDKINELKLDIRKFDSVIKYDDVKKENNYMKVIKVNKKIKELDNLYFKLNEYGKDFAYTYAEFTGDNSKQIKERKEKGLIAKNEGEKIEKEIDKLELKFITENILNYLQNVKICKDVSNIIISYYIDENEIKGARHKIFYDKYIIGNKIITEWKDLNYVWFKMTSKFFNKFEWDDYFKKRDENKRKGIEKRKRTWQLKK